MVLAPLQTGPQEAAQLVEDWKPACSTARGGFGKRCDRGRGFSRRCCGFRRRWRLARGLRPSRRPKRPAPEVPEWSRATRVPGSRQGAPRKRGPIAAADRTLLLTEQAASVIARIDAKGTGRRSWRTRADRRSDLRSGGAAGLACCRPPGQSPRLMPSRPLPKRNSRATRLPVPTISSPTKGGCNSPIPGRIHPRPRGNS